MTTLIEVLEARQVPGELPRRWFSSDTLDLIVWCDASGAPTGFQFCYDKGNSEHALTWKSGIGFSHMAVDDGEDRSRLRYKGTPILVKDGRFDMKQVARLFMESSTKLPMEITEFVSSRLRQ